MVRLGAVTEIAAPVGEPAVAAAGLRTEMKDAFCFAASFGPLGWIAERVVLKRYMEALLREGDRVVKEIAESDKWRRYL